MGIDFVIKGFRDGKSEEAVVMLNDNMLELHQEITNHSEGFEWGYGGSGPAQLALAIMFEYFKRITTDVELAMELARAFEYMFKSDFVAGLDRDTAWSIGGAKIQSWLYSIPNDLYECAIRRAYESIQVIRTIDGMDG